MIKLSLPNSLLGALIVLFLVGGAIFGYVMNIITIAYANFNDLTGVLVLRVAGLFIPPLGAIMGWV